MQLYIVKGGLLLITGEVSATAWIDNKTGEARAGLQIKAANDIRLLGSNRKDEQDSPASRALGTSNTPHYADPEEITVQGHGVMMTGDQPYAGLR